MASRLSDQHPTYWDNEGVICAGGSVVFTITGTTTAKNVFPTRADALALTNPSGSTITLDADGRTASDVWLASDVAYRIALKDSAGVTIWTRDDCSDTTAGGVTVLDPATGTDGQVQFTDGVAAYWGDVIQVPDPTGHATEHLVTDGSLIYWEAQPAETTYSDTSLPGGVLQGAVYTQIGKMRTQYGSGTAPTSANTITSVAITFPVAFASAPLHVDIKPTVAAVTSESAGVSCSYTGASTTGCTVHFFAGAENNGGATNISTAVTFTYAVTGLMA